MMDIGEIRNEDMKACVEVKGPVFIQLRTKDGYLDIEKFGDEIVVSMHSNEPLKDHLHFKLEWFMKKLKEWEKEIIEKEVD